MSPTARWFLWVARAEGLSLLLLFGVAMPLKYVFDTPEWVKPVGMGHGALFVVYAIALWHTAAIEGWSWLRVAGGAVASLIPFGTFVFERRVSDLRG
jgi:integral membrane protein